MVMLFGQVVNAEILGQVGQGGEAGLAGCGATGRFLQRQAGLHFFKSRKIDQNSGRSAVLGDVNGRITSYNVCYTKLLRTL